MRLSVAALLLLIGSAAPPLGHARGKQESTPSAKKRELVAIKCGRIHTVSHGVIERGIIVVENGLIVDVIKGDRVPDGAKVIDASDQVVIPGLVDGNTWLADAGMSAETISPEVKAVDGIDPFAQNRRALEGGVTCVYVAPGSRRLVTGRGAVVKTAGAERVLRDTFGLHVILGNAVKNPPAIYKPTILPSADNPILPAKRQYPATRMGQLAELRKAFEAVSKLNGKPDLKNGWTADRLEAFAPVLSRKEPILVTANGADDIVKAVLLAESLGIKIVLVDAIEAHKVADFLAEKKVPVLLQLSYTPTGGYGIDEKRPQPENDADVKAAATLVKAGVPLALHAPGELTDLLFIAGTTVRWGLSEEDALRAITLRPAEFLGVSERVGSIERGKHADLVFLNADPFQAVALPQRVMVDGEFVYQRKSSDNKTYDIAIADASRSKDKDIVAIKCGKILSVTQGVIQDGLILISNGKITYVGRGQAIPKNAKIIDASSDVVIPGMIDLNSHLGFHVESSETGRAMDATPPQIQVPAVKLIRLDDPALKDAAAGGVTSILLAPRSTGPCSVVKLGGGADPVVREVGAYKFVVVGGTGAQDQMRQMLQRAKKYHDEWEAYEKALKEGKQEAPKVTTTTDPKADPISGTWKGMMESPDYGMKAEFTAEMKLVGTKVTATVTTDMGGNQDSDTVEGTFANDTLTLSGERDGAQITITMKLEAPNKLKGTWKVNMQGMELGGPIECSRVAGGEGQPSSQTSAKTDKKEPKKDETLDPFRPLFRKEIPALLETRDYAAIENAVKIFRDEFGLEFVLVGADDALQLGDLLFQKLASAAFGADFLARKRGAYVNIAEALASTGVPVAFYSDETSGTKLLPLTATYAVRYGLDPFDALKALTLHPSRMLGLQNRIGSLERGRDADVVIWSGEPFNLNSRVKKVIVNGKIVHE